MHVTVQSLHTFRSAPRVQMCIESAYMLVQRNRHHVFGESTMYWATGALACTT